MEQLRKLPTGIQSFEVLRTNGCLYVDKTALVYQLVSTPVPYFLSRPRRFGKSLLISTFEAYFEGRKDLFEGLAIEKLETKWEKYPILHLDLSGEEYDSIKKLDSFLSLNLGLWEDQWGKDEREKTVSQRLKGVIKRAYQQSGKRVVVLIDEYDKPLLENILNEKLSKSLRNKLKAFYGVLKGTGKYLRFIFLTGVTKFTQVSVFSDLNQLTDISLWTDYSELCGITRQELLDTFTPELQALAKQNDMTFDEAVHAMGERYDGYHFAVNSTGMFNPFSVLNTLSSEQFDDYWFQTGTPTFLANLLTQSDYDLRRLVDGARMARTDFAEYKADTGNPIPLIYQSGYLTILGYQPKREMYTLGFPNEEVRYGFMKFLSPYYTTVSDDDTASYIDHFLDELEAGDVEGFLNSLKVFFAGIPYELSDDTERHYQTIFYVVLTLMGKFVQTEVRSAHGRADAVVKNNDYIYVFEFKLTDTAEAALRQIDEKEYLLPYTLDGRKLIKVGVSFDKEKRNIGKYLIG
ncbi:MAG: ATP-binding protein [Prevotellaceae bacterium]|jgi:hypothetical protein|nr:ATP-binding protein [Prevotellaceae bacterium]